MPTHLVGPVLPALLVLLLSLLRALPFLPSQDQSQQYLRPPLVRFALLRLTFHIPKIVEYVLVIVSGHESPSVTSPINATIGISVQLSVSSVISAIFAVGTSPMHSTFTVAGAVAVGFVRSFTMIN